jgi:hypothetical protein
MKKYLLFSFALLTVQFCLAQWEDDIRLTSTYDTSTLNYGSRGRNIASNRDTINVVWYEKVDGEFDIFNRRSTDEGVNWSTPVRLTNDPPGSYRPSVSASGSVVHVVYDSRKTGNSEIYYRRSMDGGTNWEEEQRLTDDSYMSSTQTISLSGSFVHLAWVNFDNDNMIYQVWYKHSSDGGISWEDEYMLSDNSAVAYDESMAVSGSDVYVVWYDYRESTTDIYYRKSVDDGYTWEPEIRLTFSDTYKESPRIAVSGLNVYIVWADMRDGNMEIYCKGSLDGGENWGEDTRITFDQASSTVPNLAESNSVLHVVWQDDRSGFNDVYYNYSTDGGNTWNEDTRLNDWSYSSERPFIAVSDSVLHVIWRDILYGNYEIFYKRNPTGGVPVRVEDVPLLASIGQWGVYPNPVSRQLTVVCRQSAVSNRLSAIKLSIMDLYGREVEEIGDVPSFPYQIDISSLLNGVYFLKMTDDSGYVGAVKFLKSVE